MDEVIKVSRVIKSESLKIDRLKKYIGKLVEVTIHIHPCGIEHKMPAAGILKNRGKKKAGVSEKEAWGAAMKEKYDYR